MSNAAKCTSKPEVRLIRMDEVCRLTAMSRTAVYAKIKTGDFPQPVNTYGSCKAWKLAEVEGWINGLEPQPQKAAASQVKPKKKQ